MCGWRRAKGGIGSIYKYRTGDIRTNIAGGMAGDITVGTQTGDMAGDILHDRAGDVASD